MLFVGGLITGTQSWHTLKKCSRGPQRGVVSHIVSYFFFVHRLLVTDSGKEGVMNRFETPNPSPANDVLRSNPPLHVLASKTY